MTSAGFGRNESIDFGAVRVVVSSRLILAELRRDNRASAALVPLVDYIAYDADGHLPKGPGLIRSSRFFPDWRSHSDGCSAPASNSGNRFVRGQRETKRGHPSSDKTGPPIVGQNGATHRREAPR